VKFFTCILAILLFMISCADNGTGPAMPRLPNVLAQGAVYPSSRINTFLPHDRSRQEFSAAYRGKYSQALKDELMTYIRQEIRRQGLDADQMMSCLLPTGQQDAAATALPYWVEKARYDSTDCWLFEFVWGADANDLGHYRCFIMDASTADTLLYMTCR
jgi:hypothetical protein